MTSTFPMGRSLFLLAAGALATACGGGEDPAVHDGGTDSYDDTATDTATGSDTGTDTGDAADSGLDGGAPSNDGGQDTDTGSEVDTGTGFDTDLPMPGENLERDIVSTALSVDLAVLSGTASIELAPSEETTASFEAAGLHVLGVRSTDGSLNHEVVDGRLDVGVPAGQTQIEIDYAFEVQPLFMGLMESGATLVWPYYCGNLFPCHSRPDDGLSFSLELTSIPEGLTAVFPSAIETDAPSYQIAWAVGDYVEHDLGATSGGTNLKLFTTAASEAAALAGTEKLVEVFSWFEETLGPYPFGTEAGAVEVDWGEIGGGGMEHHPYWHVSTQGLDDIAIHAHEASHAWFGDGVRIACWEDLVLSEGTASYLQPRVIGQVLGPEAEAAIWSTYAETVALMLEALDGIAWPSETCNEVDVLDGGTFMVVPYMKGAYFYRALAEEIGAEELDAVFAAFFQERVGTAAGMQDFLDTVFEQTGYDPTALADAWLRSMGIPEEI